MMIWKISQDVNNNFDSFSDAVVIAADEESARRTHPDGDHQWSEGSLEDEEGRSDWAMWRSIRFSTCPGDPSWAPPSAVKVELIGVATGNAKPGVICASFHAG